MGKNKSKRKPRTEFSKMRSLEAKLNNKMDKLNKEMKMLEIVTDNENNEDNDNM